MRGVRIMSDMLSLIPWLLILPKNHCWTESLPWHWPKTKQTEHFSGESSTFILFFILENKRRTKPWMRLSSTSSSSCVTKENNSLSDHMTLCLNTGCRWSERVKKDKVQSNRRWSEALFFILFIFVVGPSICDHGASLWPVADSCLRETSSSTLSAPQLKNRF